MTVETHDRLAMQLRRIVANRDSALRGHDGRLPSPLVRRAVNRRTATLLSDLRAAAPVGSPVLSEIEAAETEVREAAHA